MALANVAWLLAANGERVLTIDWDLEAPGLHRYFRPFLLDPDLQETAGLIDMVWSLAEQAVGTSPDSPRDEPPVPVSDLVEDVARRLDCSFPSGGYIDLLCAGRQGATYSERVNTFDWKKFYELGGAKIFDDLKRHVTAEYDYVLIDSRTGVSDTSGICTIQMPDALVACFTLNRQSIEGASAVLNSVRAYDRGGLKGDRIKTFPLATRIENSEKERLDAARQHARKRFADFVPPERSKNEREYWDEMEVPYKPYYAYEEVLAAFADASGDAGASDTLLSCMERIARNLSGEPNLSLPQMLAKDRQTVLARYAFDDTAPPKVAAPLKKRVTGASRESAEIIRTALTKQQFWSATDCHPLTLLSRREMRLFDLAAEDSDEEIGVSTRDYIENSRRYAALKRITDAVFISWIFVILFVLLYYVSVHDDGYIEILGKQVASDASLWFTIALLVVYGIPGAAALLLMRSPARPDGVRATWLLQLVMMGPLFGTPPDLERLPPSLRRSRSQQRRRTGPT
jgi:cellulose biosynthesis protein BcsQ